MKRDLNGIKGREFIYNMSTKQEIKDVVCKHCGVSYPATKEFFYTSYERLKLSICKECKKKVSKLHEKNRKPRNRIEEYRAYNLKRKLIKEALKKAVENLSRKP